MPNKFNPFRPDKIAPPGMFAGRVEELQFIDHCLLQTQHGNPQHFLIEGERGIGKSSILMCEYLVASGKLETWVTNKFLKFIVINISLEERDSYYSLIKKLAEGLKQEVSAIYTLKSLVFGALGFISRFEAGGIKYNKDISKVDEAELFRNLQSDFVNVLSKAGKEFDGVLLLIDEADKPPAEAGLGLICKLLTEELSRRNCDRLCIGLSGLPNLLGALRDSHESSLRIFRIMSLKPLEPPEIEQVLDRGVAEATEKNGFEIIITSEAKNFIASLSEGYPHFLQEFAYCAFEEDSDNVIDKADVTNSLFRENGAFDQLGRKYFDQYYTASGSDDYRLVLDRMADQLDNWIFRSDLISRSGLKPTTVDNALRALKAKNVIIQNEKRPGQYRLPTRSFAVWIKARATAERAASQSSKAPSLFGPTSPASPDPDEQKS